jgi:hypothetical protein
MPVPDRLRRLAGLSGSVRGTHRSLPAPMSHLWLRPHARRRATHTRNATTAHPRHLMRSACSLASALPPIGSPRSEAHGRLRPHPSRYPTRPHRPAASARHSFLVSAHHPHPATLAAASHARPATDPEIRTNPHSVERGGRSVQSVFSSASLVGSSAPHALPVATPR